MEQRRFCAKCNAPEIKNSGVCVVCGGTDFVLPQTEEPVKVVEIEDAVVKASVDSKFIKASPDEGVVENVSEKENVSAEPQPVEEKESIQSSEEAMSIQPKKRPTNIIPGEGRTIVYKSFAEYEKELAEKEALEGPEEKDKKNKPKKEPKKASFVIMSIILCLVLVAGGFALGVYLTHNGFLDGILHSEQIGINEAQQAEIDACNANQTDIAQKLASYVTENGIYIDKTTVVTIQGTKSGSGCIVTVEGDCLTSFECEALFGEEYVCPAGGTCVAEIIPYVDDEGNSMFKVEVTCDGKSGEWSHS